MSIESQGMRFAGSVMGLSYEGMLYELLHLLWPLRYFPQRDFLVHSDHYQFLQQARKIPRHDSDKLSQLLN